MTLTKVSAPAITPSVVGSQPRWWVERKVEMGGMLKKITKAMLRIKRHTHQPMTRWCVVCFLRFFSSMRASTLANTWAASSTRREGGGRMDTDMW